MGNACAGESKNTKPVEQVEASEEPPVAASQPEEEAKDDPKLTVTIMSARGLRNADWMPGTGKSDCYVVVKSKEKELYKTQVIKDSLEPVWMEEVKINDWEDGAALEFHLFDKDLVSSDFLGKVVLEASNFAEKGFNDDIKVEPAGKAAADAFLKLKIQVQGKELPPTPSPEFKITIDKGGEPSYGLDLDFQDGFRLMVTEVKDGPCKKFNENAQPGEPQLQKLDFIMSVNGVAGAPPNTVKDMLSQFKNEPKVELEVKRGTGYTVLVENKEDKPLGLEFPKKPIGDFLAITGISEGAVMDFNKTAKEERKISVGDRIMSVGGQRAKAAGLKQRLETPGPALQLLLVRPAEAGHEQHHHWFFGR